MALWIVGLGIVGSSLAAALARTGRRPLYGTDRDPRRVQALARWGVRPGPPPSQHLEAVILALPVRAILTWLAETAPTLPPGTRILDTGSTKARIAAAMDRLPPELEAVGGHPIAGRAHPAPPDPDLFRGRPFVLCPTARTRPETLAWARELVAALGAHPLEVDPDRHDRILAHTSALPHLTATLLAALVGDLAEEDPLTFPLSAGSFRDGTRVAARAPEVTLDLLLTNPHLPDLAREAARLLLAWSDALEAGNDAYVKSWLDRAHRFRAAWEAATGEGDGAPTEPQGPS